jgi:hypothetical protein
MGTRDDTQDSNVGPISTQPTLSGKPGLVTYSNPLFHPNMMTVGGSNAATNPSLFDPNIQSPNGAFLRRGVLVSGAGVAGNVSTNIQYRVNFLFNPQTVTETRGIDLNSEMLPSYARSPDAPGQYATALNAGVAFSLLFDRTFELWDSQSVGTIAGTYGVRADVEAFYNLLGINAQQVVSTTTGDPANGGALTTFSKSSTIVQGPMTLSPCNLYFSDTGKGALAYFGYITEMDITYTHFASNMVPTRCAIDLSFSCLPIVTSTN